MLLIWVMDKGQGHKLIGELIYGFNPDPCQNWTIKKEV